MVGLKFKKDFCITNTIKCATDNIPKENIENCRKYLVKEIEIIQPKLIIALGTVAMRALNDSVTRGNMIELANGIKVIGNWHPAYVARDVTRQKDFFNNFTNFRKEIINAR
jgi:DNA polymerase